MRRYKCHKIVEAGLIASVVKLPGADGRPGAVNAPGIIELVGGEQVEFKGGFIGRCFPPPINEHDHVEKRALRLAGMYLVRYADGYLSVSPGPAFEEGYDLLQDQT